MVGFPNFWKLQYNVVIDFHAPELFYKAYFKFLLSGLDMPTNK